MNDDFKEELKDCYADLQKLKERNAEYIGTIDRLRRRVAETDVEIERLRAALDVVRASGLLIGSTTLHDKVRAVVHAALAEEKQ